MFENIATTTVSGRTAFFRDAAYASVDAADRAQLGQFFTPTVVAEFMAGFFEESPEEVHLLDPGAGVGALTAAAVDDILRRDTRPQKIEVTAYEVEPAFLPYLKRTFAHCADACDVKDVEFSYQLIEGDFIDDAVRLLRDSSPNLFSIARARFNRVIMNPPYKKIRSDSDHRRALRSVGIETVNLYTAFMALCIRLLEPGGELVSISPRSFCNGPYYRPFRKLVHDELSLRRLHLFNARDKAFENDDVLQENIILHAVKSEDRGRVLITVSDSPTEGLQRRFVDHTRVISSDDPHLFIHVAATELEQQIADSVTLLGHSLKDLGLSVSTGRVVDFRVRMHIRQEQEPGTAPLIYPSHMQDGFVKWPDRGGRKPNAIVRSSDTERLLFPGGDYVVVRRFSSKEERRRINAAIYTPELVSADQVAFENHLNVFHADNAGLDPALARGLAVYLSATIVDRYFRQFNGHTQVNATDLRFLLYPSLDTLMSWGRTIEASFPTQSQIDSLIEKEIEKLADSSSSYSASTVAKRVQQAIAILKALGLPRAQQNDRSAMTLLALLDLRPSQAWSEAASPLIGITPIMEFIREHYGTDYAPNTRETIRRQTMHQFVQAGLAVENPDEPGRPKNSPKWCYQVSPVALDVIRAYDNDSWSEDLAAYLKEVPALREQYARRREMLRVEVKTADGINLTLSPGAHSELMKGVVEQFAPRFAPGSRLVYVGDTGAKDGYFDKALLADLGVTLHKRGKLPDVILYFEEKDWLLLVEAVTSHGPVDPKRRQELGELFATARPGIIYVTAFPSMGEMARYLKEISWETEVWVAESPTHLIHFDGERFLGPYQN